MALSERPRLQGRVEKNDIDGGWTLGMKTFIRQSGFDRTEEVAQEYCRSLLDPSTGKVRRDIVTARPCPLCGSGPSQWQALWVKEGFDYYACRQCGMSFVCPVLRPEWAFEMYTSSKFMTSYFEMMRHPTRDRFERAKYLYALQLIEDLKGWRSGKLLDVGCGAGRFLDIAAEAGWQAEGVEIARRCVEEVRARGLTIHEQLFRAEDFKGSGAELIASWDVLEHVLDPRGLVQEMVKALSEHGVLLVSVPNIDSLAARVLHQANTQFCGYSHINYFGVKTLTRMLEEAGLRITHLETYISEVYVANVYLRSLEPGCEEQLLPFLTPEWIHQQLMGNKLLALAERAPEAGRA